MCDCNVWFDFIRLRPTPNKVRNSPIVPNLHKFSHAQQILLFGVHLKTKETIRHSYNYLILSVMFISLRSLVT